MANWENLELEVSTHFRPGSGDPWSRKKIIPYDEVVKHKTVSLEDFTLTIKNITPQSFSATIEWYYDGLRLDAGRCELDANKRSFESPDLNVAYDTHMRIEVYLQFEHHYKQIRTVIEKLNPDWAMVAPPATLQQVAHCNQLLHQSGMPALPSDYTMFMQICSALSFNGMDIFGIYENGIVEQTKQMRCYYEGYEGIEQMLFIGRIDDDYYTYDAATRKYQSRDITGFEIWDEYDSFKSFFLGEMMKWLV